MADYSAFLDAPDDSRHDAFLEAPNTKTETKGHTFKQYNPNDSVIGRIFGKYAPDVLDWAAGATSTARGALNLISPGTGNKLLPLTNPGMPYEVNKESVPYVAGEITDPTAMAVGMGAGKVVQAIPAATKAYKAAEATRAANAARVAGTAARNVPLTTEAVLRSGAAGGAGGAGAAYLASEGDLENTGKGGMFGTGVGMVLPVAGKGLQGGLGFLTDLVTGQSGKVKAAQIARAAAGTDLSAIRAAMAAAGSDVNAGQAAYGIDNNMWQALQKYATSNDPSGYFSKLSKTQQEGLLDAMNRVAGGSNLAEAATTRAASKTALNQVTTPMRDIELGAANTAGMLLPKLQGEADRMGQFAANKVEDVRRFTEAQQRASALAQSQLNQRGYPFTRLPSQATEFTYLGGDIPQRAEQVAGQSATASLAGGEAARFAQMRADSLAQHGLTPIDTSAITNRLNTLVNDPKIGPSDLNRKVLTKVSDLINEWTQKNGGVIDAEALYTIRKSAVNDAIEQLRPSADAKTKANMASSLLSSVRPLIDDAIEKAGGTGWRDYLTTFSEGMKGIDQSKMASKLTYLFKTDPVKFQQVMEGNDPKFVEKVFGPGTYDIVKEMGSKIAPFSEGLAVSKRSTEIAAQADAGSVPLANVIRKLTVGFRLPGQFSATTTSANKALEFMEKNLSEKAKIALIEGMKTGKSAQELIDTLPASDRNKVLLWIGQAGRMAPAAAGVTGELVSNK